MMPGRWSLLALLVALALALVAPRLLEPYFVGILTRVLIFAIFAMGLNLLMGYTGLPSLGQGAYLAVGAYTVGILAKKVGTGYLLASGAGVAMAGMMGAAFGLIALRARGASFLMITLALTQAVWAIAFTWRSLTGGDDGFPSVGRPEIGFLPWSLSDTRVFYYFVLVFLVLALAVFYTIVRSPYGLALQGTRDNELRMRSLGYNTWLLQYVAFIIAALFAGLAGVLYAFHVGAIAPGWAGVTPSAEALLMVIIGGPGTVVGPLVGAGVIIPVSEVANIFTQRWMMVLGATYVVVILFAPDGIVGRLRRLVPRRQPA